MMGDRRFLVTWILIAVVGNVVGWWMIVEILVKVLDR
jgi:hypothetical protein